MVNLNADDSTGTIARRRKRRQTGINYDEDDDHHISSEILEAEDKSRTLKGRNIGLRGVENPRPFEVIGDLPCTIEVPQYGSALTHPLSVKDSGVLYYSLMTSRKKWVTGAMFETYWTKTLKPKEESTPDLNSGNESIRDKMQKMSDCTLYGGPHTFFVRIFILKDEEIERKWQIEQDIKKKEKVEKRRSEAEAKLKKKEDKKYRAEQKKLEKEMKAQKRKELREKARMEKEALKSKTKVEPKKRGPAKRNSSKDQNSSDDSKLIANLNFMAQRDSELSTLMRTVARGEATFRQIEKFKKFIDEAKTMPPPPGWKPPTPAKTNSGTRSRNTAPNNRSKDETTKKTNEKVASQALDVSNDAVQTGNDKCNDETDDAERSLTQPNSGSESSTIKQENMNGDGKIRRRRRRANAKEPEDPEMHLTAFQLKYLNGGELVLEFDENKNTRFRIPSMAVLEFQEAPNNNIDYILSWIKIHNERDINRFKAKKLRQMNKTKISTDDEIQDIPPIEVYSDPECPSPLYTPMTVRITGVHKKFNPIMVNSMKPLEEVQNLMKAILKIGTRLSGYNPWFQLDGYDDADLSEWYRSEMQEYENSFRVKRVRKQ